VAQGCLFSSRNDGKVYGESSTRLYYRQLLSAQHVKTADKKCDLKEHFKQVEACNKRVAAGCLELQ